jgi:membrane-associated HD superfamily phosphohydrolase
MVRQSKNSKISFINKEYIKQKFLEGLNEFWKGYLGNRSALIISRLYGLLCLFLIIIIGIVNYEKRKYLFPISDKNKLTAFLLVWLLLLLFFYILAKTTPINWRLYLPSVPFSILLSLLFIGSLQDIKWSSITSRVYLFKQIAALVILLIVILFLLYSFPTKRINELNPDTKYAAMFVDKLMKVVPKLPNGTTIYIYNVPQNIFNHYSIKRWLDLAYPSNKVKAVFLHNTPPVNTLPDCLDFEMQSNKTNEKIEVYLKTKECLNN